MKRFTRWNRNVCAKIAIFVISVVGSAQAVGSPSGIESSPSWLEHWDIVRVLITALFGIIAWFLIKALNKFDSNQDELFSRLRTLETEHAKLKGRCDGRHEEHDE